MKNYLLLLSACCCLHALPASAKNYYVSATGNNSNSGLTETTAWQTITKVNTAFANMVAGDSILFKRDDSFYGTLVVSKSGSSGKPIVISAYGTGDKPIITGFVTASSWNNVSGGVYQTNIPGAKGSLNMVTLNNLPQAIGRYPNAADSNGGYLKYESFSGSTSITDNELTSATNWTGAEVVIRKKLWVLDRCKITAHSGTTLTFTNTNGSTYTGTANYGYFIQNDIRTLDQMGEWYFNSSTKYLQMYFGTEVPSSYAIKISTLDTLLTIVSKSYININNIVFEGANSNAVYASGNSFINIQNCDFVNAGVGAMNLTSTSNLLIENCTTNNILSNAINANCSKASNITIRGCSIKNTGTLPGMGLSNGGSYKGIVATALSNLMIEYNKVDTTGYIGIEFQGSNVNVQYNVVNYFDFVKDDGGGIYTYVSGTDAIPGATYTNRTISNNIVTNGVSAPAGRFSSSLFASGIYLDGRTMNVSVLNNTVFNNAKNGIHCSNPGSVTIKGNTSYNNLNAMSVMRWAWGSINGLSITDNIFYPKTTAQKCLYYTNAGLNEPAPTTLQAVLTGLGSIDSNTYSMLNPVGFNFEIYGTTGGALIQSSPLSLEGWKAFSTHDLNGKKPVKLPIGFKVTGLTGTNKFTNGLFTSSISGVTIFGTNVTGAWDNTSKISGGSLKISFSSPAANKYSLIHSPIGAVNTTKQYVLRFSTYGTTQQGIVRAYIRKSTSPYNNLVSTQTKSFGIGRTDHEFLFNNPITEAGGSFVIELEQNSGITYIDNVEFYEATASLYDIATQLRFEYNDTKITKTITLDTKYTGVNGELYEGSLTLEPFTSAILIKDTATVTTVAARKVTAAKIIPAVTNISESKPLHLKAYPNPSATVFNLTVDGGSNDKITLLVYSFDGKMMYQATGNSNTNYSFGNNFIPGMYILKVIQGNTIQTLKLIKAGR